MHISKKNEVYLQLTDVEPSIAAELNSESNDRISAYHGSHSSGHSSRGGHNSSTAKVERPLRTNKK